MRISLEWLKRYVEIEETAEELALLLTNAGLEVSSVEKLGEGIDDLVVGQILEKGQHPNADRLSLCKVTDGEEEYSIVCGATNMVAGDKVALARVGARLPGNFKIKKSKIRGEVSFGMMCSEREMGLGDDHAGIMILPGDTALGVKVADVLGLPETVIEVEITPNRPDWLSVVGVAREVAAITGRALHMPEPEFEETGTTVEELTSVVIEDPELCGRYAARVIKDVKIGPSPLWVQRHLRAAGVRSINNVVDATNYVLMELGHPLHAFDYAKLAEGRIVVRRAEEGSRFTTLDDVERPMDSESLMICDGAGPVALGGIMGGQNSEVSEKTVDVLLESAWFAPPNIRRTGKRLGLSTEASYRFERGADIDGLTLALDRCTEFIAKLADGKVAPGIWDCYPAPATKRELTIRLEKIKALLGVAVAREDVEGYLTGLGLEVTGSDAATLTVNVPHFRVDLEREVDLIEEVARLYGYDNIPVTLPKLPVTPAAVDETTLKAEGLRDLLSGIGMSEAINYSFVDPEDDEKLGLSDDDPKRRKVGLQNPLTVETSVMRTSLVVGLLKVAELNARRRNLDLRLFEIGRTFHPSGEELPHEHLKLASLMCGRRNAPSWLAANEQIGFYEAKGVVELVLGKLAVTEVKFSPADDIPFLHPGRTAEVIVSGSSVGWVGELTAKTAEAYELSAPVALFELDLDVLAGSAAPLARFGGIEKFPAIERDLALVADKKTPAGKIIDTIEALDEPLVRSVALFDAFTGGKLPEDKQSLAYRITYRAEDRTLTEEETSQVEGRIMAALAEGHGVRLRDS